MKRDDRVKYEAGRSRKEFRAPVFGIPDPALNEKLVAVNDNAKPTSLSRENFEEESILSHLDQIKPRKSSQIGLIIAVAFCFMVLVTFILLAARHW
jgi:hypothetical protein